MQSDLPIPDGVQTRVVRLGRGAAASLPQVLHAVGVPRGSCCVVLCDARTMTAAGDRVEASLGAGGYQPRRCVLPDDRPGEVSGDREQVDHATAAARGCDAIVGVGSGVINDLGKLAARHANRPYLSVPTAASINGYGSPISAIIDGGVKRTLPAAVTLAIVADLDILCAAPIDLTRSGFADVLSKASATADWMLAHLVRDEPYDPRPHELLDPAVRACQQQAGAIGRGEQQAVATLMHGLIYGAFAMTIAGHSAPASGGEHLISHLWDMQAHARKTPHALHGFQVAFGTRLSAALYERLLMLEAEDIDVDRLAAGWRPWEQVRRGLGDVHGDLFDAIEPEAAKQHLSQQALRDELSRLRARWDEIGEAIRPLLLTSQRLRELHAAAGVPTEPAVIGQTRQTMRHALLHARDVRARFTVLDLAATLGVLEPWADGIVDEAMK